MDDKFKSIKKFHELQKNSCKIMMGLDQQAKNLFKNEKKKPAPFQNCYCCYLQNHSFTEILRLSLPNDETYRLFSASCLNLLWRPFSYMKTLPFVASLQEFWFIHCSPKDLDLPTWMALFRSFSLLSISVYYCSPSMRVS